MASNEGDVLIFVSQHGHLTVEEFAAQHSLATWCALFNRGLVMVLHGTIALTTIGERAVRHARAMKEKQQ
jgi:hypothetical protein